MSEMVERVAKAIEGQMGGKSTDMARAAIEAMREPTDEMLGRQYGTEARKLFTDMIDAALGNK